MSFLFKTRSLARTFANKTNRKVKDNGVSSLVGKRWAVPVVK